MKFESKQLVVKVSVSDMLKSRDFYVNILGFKLDEKYTINAGKNYGPTSYMQLDFMSHGKNAFTIGLYKDISAPIKPLPQTGTVPSFIVADVEATLKHFLALKVAVDKTDGHYIISNTSDKGYTDKFFFFRDPDNNSLVIRQNMN